MRKAEQVFRNYNKKGNPMHPEKQLFMTYKKKMLRNLILGIIFQKKLVA